MSALTLVYVLTIVFILIANKKSSDTAVASNKQQFALQLLDRRLNAYYSLEEWIMIAKTLLIQNFPMGTSLDAFNAILYNNAKNEYLEEINNQLKTIQYHLSHGKVSSEEKEQLVAMRDQLIQDRFLKRFAMIGTEVSLINQIEVLFPKARFGIIKSFCDSFTKAAFEQSTESLEQLKMDVQKIMDKDILGSLWKEIKDI